MRQNNSRIDDLSQAIQNQLIDRIKVSGRFSIQLDGSTDVVTFHMCGVDMCGVRESVGSVI